MFCFVFKYSDKTALEFHNITKVDYTTAMSEESISGDQLLAHKYPLNFDMHLFGDDCAVSASARNLISIEVFKES
jgi:hypothetical protein